MSSIERKIEQTILELRRFVAETRRRNSLSERARTTMQQQEAFITNSANRYR
jgi:hypothetical protein